MMRPPPVLTGSLRIIAASVVPDDSPAEVVRAATCDGEHPEARERAQDAERKTMIHAGDQILSTIFGKRRRRRHCQRRFALHATQIDDVEDRGVTALRIGNALQSLSGAPRARGGERSLHRDSGIVGVPIEAVFVEMARDFGR